MKIIWIKAIRELWYFECYGFLLSQVFMCRMSFHEISSIFPYPVTLSLIPATQDLTRIAKPETHPPWNTLEALQYLGRPDTMRKSVFVLDVKSFSTALL